MLSCSLFIAAPDGARSPLTVEEFRTALLDRSPGARTKLRHPTEPRRRLGFTVGSGTGHLSGFFSELSGLTLNDADGETWADFILWYLALPPGHPVEMATELSAELSPGTSNPMSLPLPEDSTREDVVRIYRALTDPYDD